MEKINKTIFILLCISSVLLIDACTDNYKELNTDPAILNEDIVNVDLILTYLEKEAFRDQASAGYRTYGSYCGMCRRDDDGPFSDRPSGGIWSAVYRNLLNNSNDIIRLIDMKEDKADLVNKTAIARIIKAWSVAYLTDTYGDVPYTEACLPMDQVNYHPKYDLQKDIYADMFKELKEAAAQLNTSKESFGSADLVYQGDPAKWKKLANSLRLRQALRVCYADADLAKAQMSDLSESDLITAVADDAVFPYSDDQPEYRNPRFVYVTSFGSATNDQVFAHKVMIDVMMNDGVNLDPRIKLYADTVKCLFKGGISPNGYEVPNWLYRGRPTLGAVDPIYQSPWLSETVSRLADFWRVAITKPAIMKSSEVYFNLAEAKLRGLLPAGFTGTANEYYQKAIDLSIEWYQDFYDLTAPQIPELYALLYPTMTEDAIAEYLEYKKMQDADIEAFKATPIYTLAGTFEEQLEMIINQKIIALYPDEYQGWTEYRRTGYPKIPIGPDKSPLKGVIPRREVWPEIEETLNPEKYEEVLARFGGKVSRGDRILWWDANPDAPHEYIWPDGEAPSMPTGY